MHSYTYVCTCLLVNSLNPIFSRPQSNTMYLLWYEQAPTYVHTYVLNEMYYISLINTTRTIGYIHSVKTDKYTLWNAPDHSYIHFPDPIKWIWPHKTTYTYIHTYITVTYSIHNDKSMIKLPCKLLQTLKRYTYIRSYTVHISMQL